MKGLVKAEVLVAAISFALIFLSGVVGHFIALAGADEKTVDMGVKAAILLFFCLFGFSLIGLMLHVFIVMQAGAGNGNVPMIRFLADHEAALTFGAWGFLALGTMVALPFALYDIGFRLPLRSQGVLSADIGMTIEEVKQRSSIKMKEPSLLPDGSRKSVEDMVFEFRIGDSAVRFPKSRYYLLQTAKNDPHISVLHIGITPEKMSKAATDTFQRAAQTLLSTNGWMPGHYIADSEETVRLWGGKHTSGDGRYWAKGNTVLIFERSRMDDEKPDEPPDSGEYIIAIQMRSKDAYPDLVFERSAWPPA